MTTPLRSACRFPGRRLRAFAAGRAVQGACRMSHPPPREVTSEGLRHVLRGGGSRGGCGGAAARRQHLLPGATSAISHDGSRAPVSRASRAAPAVAPPTTCPHAVSALGEQHAAARAAQQSQLASSCTAAAAPGCRPHAIQPLQLPFGGAWGAHLCICAHRTYRERGAQQAALVAGAGEGGACGRAGGKARRGGREAPRAALEGREARGRQKGGRQGCR